MIIAEICLQCIQSQNLPLAPVEKPVLHRPILDGPIKHFRHEQRHRILVNVVPDPRQSITRRCRPCSPKTSLLILSQVQVNDVERQKPGHACFGIDPNDETPPPEGAAERVENYRILFYLREIQDYNLLFH